jgi:hypothetical protein
MVKGRIAATSFPVDKPFSTPNEGCKVLRVLIESAVWTTRFALGEDLTPTDLDIS